MAWNRRGGSIIRIVATLGIVLVIGVVAASWLYHRSEAVRTAQAWAITGPPCPTASQQTFAASAMKPHMAYEFGDVSFTRAYGHVSCQEITNDGGRGFGTFPECQFTSPGLLQVTTKRGDFYFIVETGPATVMVKDDVPSCVRAGNFHGEQLSLSE